MRRVELEILSPVKWLTRTVSGHYHGAFRSYMATTLMAMRFTDERPSALPRQCLAAVLILCLAATGCRSSSSHTKWGWVAEEYFEDPQVIALCHAIERNDLPEIDRILAAGVNVAARGKGNMTPLMWAYPDNKPERMLKLLEHGADPNVVFTDDFGVKGMFRGTSVTHLAAGTAFGKYFDYVFANGGDPNQVCTTALWTNITPLFEVICGPAHDKGRKIARLIEMGADIDFVSSGTYWTPTIAAVSCGQQFDLALQLLEAGADFRTYGNPKSNRQLIHSVLSQGKRREGIGPQKQAEYKELLAWLESHGVDVESAAKDLGRWSNAPGPEAYRRMMDAEVAARKAHEN